MPWVIVQELSPVAPFFFFWQLVKEGTEELQSKKIVFKHEIITIVSKFRVLSICLTGVETIQLQG